MDKATENTSEGGCLTADSTVGSRWWDLYILRYTVGTVFGAVIVELLARRSDAVKALVPAFDFEKLEWQQLALLAVYGLVYCLIASAPILVAHATRHLIEFSGRTMGQPALLRSIRILGIPFAIGLVAYLIQLHGSGQALFLGLMSFVWALIMLSQILALWKTLCNSKEQYKYYERLSERRALASGDFLNSYRHLREHGNSFLIVMLEITMGMLLYAATLMFPTGSSERDPVLLAITPMLFILIWIFPAAGVWLVGTGLERHFSDGKSTDSKE